MKYSPEIDVIFLRQYFVWFSCQVSNTEKRLQKHQKYSSQIITKAKTNTTISM